VAAPIAGAQPPALLVGFTRERRQVAPLELAGLAAAASSLSLLLERERSVIALAQSADEQHRLSAATLSGQDSERRRLAFELHDGIGQTLAAALLHLGLAGRAERAGTDALQTGTALVRQAIDELRGLARDLHPPALAQQGLPLTLHALASSMSSERMLIVSEIQPPAVFDLGPATSLALFRISQAALTNVATHSRARRATLRLRVSPVEAQLEIEDDGVGFHSAQTLHGVGLLGMRERAASLGGTIAIESELGRGTMIRATVPLPGRR
jgi:two-component system sensor histidine kinase UhpB